MFPTRNFVSAALALLFIGQAAAIEEIEDRGEGPSSRPLEALSGAAPTAAPAPGSPVGAPAPPRVDLR